MVKTLQYLNLLQVYPAVLADFNLNTCGDPDCGNFGVAPDFSIPVFKGKNAAQRRQAAAASIPALTTGLGSYTMSSDDHHPRTSEVFEYAGDPIGWDDGRSMECGQPRPCALHLRRRNGVIIHVSTKLPFPASVSRSSRGQPLLMRHLPLG